MNNIGFNKIVFFLFVLLSFQISIPVFSLSADDYYLSVDGSDGNNGSIDSPWATFAYAMDHLTAGDTLIIKDGTYTEKLFVDISGTSGNPITIKAENEGQVIMNGTNNSRPAHVYYANYIALEGLIFTNSNSDVLSVYQSDNIDIKKCSASNAGVGNYMVFLSFNSTNVTYEDCIAYGSGRTLFNILGCQNVTLRRCWGRWESHSGGGGGNNCFVLYGSDDCIIENCVGTMDSTSGEDVDGINLWANSDFDSVDRNKICGNTMYGLSGWSYSVSSILHRIEGNRFYDNVSINTANGFYQRADADLQVRNLTIVDTNNIAFALQEYSYEPKDSDYVINGDLRNSILQSGDKGLSVNSAKSPRLESFTNEYNNLYDFNTTYSAAATQGTGNISVYTGWNTNKYGKGAYLFVPEASEPATSGENGARMGAEVLYCYHDGVLTNAPLWPWPMEDRILAETGISVTWESRGGIWDDTTDFDTLYGTTDTTAPSINITSPTSNSTYNTTRLLPRTERSHRRRPHL
ncbi:MAG: hypothetical protein E3K37_18205 [Candidatus Kuenenia sp.]|nr:hypothetical protein [Candidatus Kuenenia hertensis]